MLSIADSTSVFLIPGVTDMRKGIERLSTVVASMTTENIFSGAYFLFCSRNRKTVKILYWDRNGFCLWQKKLDKEKFWWPKDVEDVKNLEPYELRWILDGLDPTSIHGHQTLNYSSIF
ncbi:MAG: IS66 family insertion sequence element accessory protein TnpB [Desulfovibrio sp.]|nr:IS66 family insertion sequence element accessory protein TnpB [Desulfovibrio sp.]